MCTYLYLEIDLKIVSGVKTKQNAFLEIKDFSFKL